MNHRYSNLFLILFVGLFFVTGCATTRARQAKAPDANAQIAQLQSELEAKDQQLQQAQAALQQYESPQGGNAFYQGSRSSSSSSVIRVAGVSALDVQKALLHAGLDPGPLDGKIGKKTKSAIKQFQRNNNLSADGIVGEKTWILLK